MYAPPKQSHKVYLPLYSRAKMRHIEGVSDKEKYLFTRGAYLGVRDTN